NRQQLAERRPAVVRKKRAVRKRVAEKRQAEDPANAASRLQPQIGFRKFKLRSQKMVRLREHRTASGMIPQSRRSRSVRRRMEGIRQGDWMARRGRNGDWVRQPWELRRRKRRRALYRN